MSRINHSSRSFVYYSVLVAVMISLFNLNPVFSADEQPGFFRFPNSDGKSVIFTSEGDLWKVPLTGGSAQRLTSHIGDDRFAFFSPDGKWIAYSGQDDAQTDIYVIPAAGGEPRRLTYHPFTDQVVGWTPDGKVLFRSLRDMGYYEFRMFTVSPEGGWPEPLDMGKCALLSYEPNGNRIAFNRYSREFRNWKRYKGGWAQDIWIGDIAKRDFKNITDNAPVNDWDGTDAFPMWHTDGRIYFMSDRDGRANIYSMKPDGSDLKQHTKLTEFDVRWPSLGNGIIVYQHGMDIWKYDIAAGINTMIPIMLPSDRVQARVKFVEPAKYISTFDLSPDGSRILFCTRGELFTVPVKKDGLIRQLTFTPAEREKTPAWHPEGKSIAVWTDKSGEDELYLFPSEGGNGTKIGTDGSGWHFEPSWSPDGSMLAFGNERFEIVVMDAKTGKTQVIDKGDWEIRDYSWSADSKFLTYSRTELNHNSSVRIWDVMAKKAFSVTDDFYNNYSPVFDPEGKYLYFLSDRIANPHIDRWEELYIRDRATQPFVVALQKGAELPFAVKADPSGDEDEWGDNGDDEDKHKGKDKADKKKDDKGKNKDEKKVEEVKIDFDGISHRIIAVPVPGGNYFGLTAVKNKIFYMSYENKGMLGDELFEDEQDGVKLHKYNIKKKKHSIVSNNIEGYDISFDGEKLLIRQEGQYMVMGIDDKPEGGWGDHNGGKGDDDEDSKFVDLSGWDMRVDVRSEWRQMFHESWRLQRDFFWDPNMHGVNWKEVYNRYAPLANRISTREELNNLIGEMFAELNCSHTYVWGGDMERPKFHSTGMLGVDVIKDKSGFYRIENIIAGRTWDPKLSSPLSAPHINAQIGEYIVAINGRSTAAVPNYLELLLNKADKVTSVLLNTNPSLEGAREVILKPLGSEWDLRYYAWVDNRRAYVAEKSKGQIGYIHLTDMGSEGLTEFTGSYSQQFDKPALILDVRYNGGGWVAEMILSHLARDAWSLGMSRHGHHYRRPWTAFYGHMAAVCNAETGSDGETFTEGFKRLNLGKVIGTRTWGGWVGIRGDKATLDRGLTTQPEFTGWGIQDGKWLIESWGAEPDIVQKEDPTDYYTGKDAQLDKTIEYLLEQMRTNPKKMHDMPEFPKDRGHFSK